MKKNYIILSCIIGLFSCKSTSEISTAEIYGTYVAREFNKLNSILELNKTGTYKYTSISWFQHLVSEGKWEYKDRDIILNSYEICDIFIYDTIQSEIVKWPTTIEIMVKGNNGDPLIGAKISNTKTGKKYNTDINGFCEIEQVDKKDRIEISYIGYKSFDFDAKELIKEKFTIALSERHGIIPPNEEKLLFQNRKLQLTKNRLFDMSANCIFKKQNE